MTCVCVRVRVRVLGMRSLCARRFLAHAQPELTELCRERVQILSHCCALLCLAGDRLQQLLQHRVNVLLHTLHLAVQVAFQVGRECIHPAPNSTDIFAGTVKRSTQLLFMVLQPSKCTYSIQKCVSGCE